MQFLKIKKKDKSFFIDEEIFYSVDYFSFLRDYFSNFLFFGDFTSSTMARHGIDDFTKR